MNLREQKRKLIIFLTLCMLILGAFILVLTNNTIINAVTCEHEYNGTWLYEGKNTNGEYIHYQYCTKCQIRKEEKCYEIGFNIKNYTELLGALGVLDLFPAFSYDESDCFSVCGVCKNLSSPTTWTVNLSDHEFQLVPYEDATDLEKPNYTGTCTTKGEVVEVCIKCGLRQMKDGELDPRNHDINIAEPLITMFATCVRNRIPSILL